MIESNTPPMRLAWMVWGLGAIFYLMGFFQRVAPAVITTELMKEFDINAAALGNLSAFYFYSYVAMQIPTGILSDTQGPRRLLVAGALVAAVGTLMFSMAHSFTLASVGRFLIGASVAVAFVGMLKLANNWFPPHYYAMVSGVALFSGIMGGVSAGTPLRLLVDAFGWRQVIFVSAMITFIIAAAIWLIVRDDPAEKGYTSPNRFAGSTTGQDRKGIIDGFIQVFRHRNTWLLLMIPGGLCGSVLAFSGLWGVPYFTTHYGLSASRAAALTSSLLVAWAVGGPVFGALSDRIGRRKPLYLVGHIVGILTWFPILFIPNLSFGLLIVLLLTSGFFSGCIIISFAFAKESVPANLAGTISGVTNMGVILGVTLLQPAIGFMLDRFWSGDIIDGVRIYDITAYQAGFSLMIGWSVIAFILLFFTRETNCRQMQ
ncbi:MAG: MFS transporter [Deltaproteobacteria bacterium]|nr:MFS transporter [Deltaproteobacteria bacterium]